MGNVPKPNIVWKGAHPTNFTYGRPGAGRDGRKTDHHVVGSADSAVVAFNQAGRGSSATFTVTDKPDVVAYQSVNLNDTPHSDGNWDSNLRTISVEHHGDWRHGYRNNQVIENAAKLTAWLRDQGLINRHVRHHQVSQLGTACPCDLPCEEIWARAGQIIAQYNQPVIPPQPQWLRNRQAIAEKTVYAQHEGIFVRNLSNPDQAADSRRFILNQNFVVRGRTKVGDREFYITKSSMDTNAPNGLSTLDVADKPYVPPQPIPSPPPKPETPEWADSLLVDEANRSMYVIRATPLIDLENGYPYIDPKTNKQVWYQAGDIIHDVSAHTIVSGVTYALTEYSFLNARTGKWGIANGIKSDDLSVDPQSAPVGTPANPTEPATKPVTPPGPVQSEPDKENTGMQSTSPVSKAIAGAIVAILVAALGYLNINFGGAEKDALDLIANTVIAGLLGYLGVYIAPKNAEPRTLR